MLKTAHRTSVIYEEIIDVTHDYLGPSSRRFITHLAKAHLNKKPSELTRGDIAELHKWGIKAFALIAENDEMLAEFSIRLLALKSK